MKKRFANIELLRIIAMLFVIVLHYLGKGGTLLAWGDDNFTVNSYIAWAVEAFALVAVNVYVLISGYFLVDSQFKIMRIIKLWMQVFFYSAGIWLIFLVLGKVPADYNGAYWYSMFLMPITSQHYWFASSYLFLCLLAPFLGVAARKMSKKQLRTCIVVLLLLFSRVWRILLPMSAAIDDRGYGICWFVCLFMIAAYIRLYVPINGKWIKPFFIYVLSSVALFLSLPGIGTLSQITGKLPDYYHVFYEYNAPFTMIGAIAMFLAFRNMHIEESKMSNAINKLASLTFGVYLLHEHTLLRSLWNSFWRVAEYYQTRYFLIHFIVVVACIFLAGCIIDAFRQFVFCVISRLFHLEKLGIKLSKVERFFNDEKKETNNG